MKLSTILSALSALRGLLASQFYYMAFSHTINKYPAQLCEVSDFAGHKLSDFV